MQNFWPNNFSHQEKDTQIPSAFLYNEHKWFERGVKEATYVGSKHPSLNKGGGLKQNSRIDTDGEMEVAYTCDFLAVSDSSTCPERGTSDAALVSLSILK